MNKKMTQFIMILIGMFLFKIAVENSIANNQEEVLRNPAGRYHHPGHHP